MSAYPHETVLLQPAVSALLAGPAASEAVYVDATFGRGGHARHILQQMPAQARLLGIDRDAQAVLVGQALAQEHPAFCMHQGDFAQLDAAVHSCLGVNQVQGILLDIGVSSPQLDDGQRGFSFSQDGPLDMRMDVRTGPTAAQWLAQASAEAMADVFWRYGEERFSRRIAQAIVQRRAHSPFERTVDLAQVVAQAHPRWQRGKHPATRVFQAIRIHINDELGQLSAALTAALTLLAPGGRLVVISFHSLEDRLVKRFIKQHSAMDIWPSDLPITHTQVPRLLQALGKAIKPDQHEVQRNPRARSAVMRVAQRLAEG